jgi:hypothetical protein
VWIGMLRRLIFSGILRLSIFLHNYRPISCLSQVLFPPPLPPYFWDLTIFFNWYVGVLLISYMERLCQIHVQVSSIPYPKCLGVEVFHVLEFVMLAVKNLNFKAFWTLKNFIFPIFGLRIFSFSIWKYLCLSLSMMYLDENFKDFVKSAFSVFVSSLRSLCLPGDCGDVLGLLLEVLHFFCFASH